MGRRSEGGQVIDLHIWVLNPQQVHEKVYCVKTSQMCVDDLARFHALLHFSDLRTAGLGRDHWTVERVRHPVPQQGDSSGGRSTPERGRT